jgi:uroporphyrinogen-III decarboxylase
VGVFAEAFGCPFEWNDNDAPWTCTIVDSIEKLKKLKKPQLKDAQLLQRVLRTTEYFNDETKGLVSIAATDTQSPIDTLTLICDTTWFLTEAYDYPDEFHRVLSDITDLIIDFTLAQRSLCAKPINPGHIMWSPDIIKGTSISEDVLVMIGPDFYNEFARPYNERIAEALGGVAIHSCGNWAHNFEQVRNTQGLTMVDLKISKTYDPTPCIPQDVINAFKDTGIAVQTRADYNDIQLINQLLRPDMRTVIVLRWDDDPKVREHRYHDIKRRWEASKQR